MKKIIIIIGMLVTGVCFAQKENKLDSLEIYNNEGKLLHTYTNGDLGKKLDSIDAVHKRGMYFVRGYKGRQAVTKPYHKVKDSTVKKVIKRVRV